MPKVMFNGQEVEAIDCTPTWEAAARIHIQCLRYGKDNDAKNGAELELIRLGQFFDNAKKDLRDYQDVVEKLCKELDQKSQQIKALQNEIELMKPTRNEADGEKEDY